VRAFPRALPPTPDWPWSARAATWSRAIWMRRPPIWRGHVVRRDDSAGCQRRLRMAIASMPLWLAQRRAHLAGVVDQAGFWPIR